MEEGKTSAIGENNNKTEYNAETGTIRIKDLVISNPDTVAFFKDKENLDDWVTKSIIIGAVGLRQMVLTENVDFVEKEFNRFLAKSKEIFENQSVLLNDKIENTFSMKNTQSPLYQLKVLIDQYFNKDKGHIRDLIDETFNIDNKTSAFSQLIEELRRNSQMGDEKISELLDSNKMDSPARQLKEQIIEKLNEIRDRELKDIRDNLLKESAIQLEKERGTAKGFVFEERVVNILETIASYYEDSVIPTGEKTGTSGKKGDIMIETENGKNIIIECKDSSGYSSRMCIDEIKEAIKNRNSEYGIFLFANREEMPKPLTPIKITDKYLITYFDEDNLYFAYRIARLFVSRKNNVQGEEINFETISSEISQIEENFKHIDLIQLKATAIINSGEYIKTNLKKVRENIEESLVKIKGSLGQRFETIEEPQ